MLTEESGLERKFCAAGGAVTMREGCEIAGYASLFGVRDQGGDTVMPGAYVAALKRLAARGGKVKMLWQHDPAQPIGVWEDVREDAHGLHVRGRLLDDVARAREAAALIAAGAIDGLSIGYRTVRATKDAGGRRSLTELDLWEVSLVTFPMLPEARLNGKAGADEAALEEMAAALRRAGEVLAGS